jgi:cobalt/nickel transport system ATP-binding protein
VSAPALEFAGVTVRYEPAGTPAVADLTFSVAAGERVALIGLNGSGKTTLLMAAAGLAPHDGRIAVDGEQLAPRTLPAIRDRIGVLFNVPEDQLLFPRVIDDVAFGLLRRGEPSAAAAAAATRTLETLGVAHLADCPLHHLSHGQKLRVALAGALIGKPSLLLLDEPSAGLDPLGNRALASVLCSLPAAMVIATHDLDFAERVCTRFLLLDAGRIVVDSAQAAAIRQRWGMPSSR